MNQSSTHTSSTKRAAEPDLLEEDVNTLETIMASPTADIPTKEWAARLANQIRQSRIMSVQLTEAAERLGVKSVCRQFTDEEVASFMALPKDGEGSRLHQLIERSFLKPNLEYLGELSQQDVVQFLDYIYSVFVVALSDEYVRRRTNVERTPGRAIREMIVEQDDPARGSRLKSVAQSVIAPHHLNTAALSPLAFPQSVGNDSFSDEARAEACSMAIERLAGEVSDLWSVSPPAASPRFFESAMGGSFDKAFWRTRDHVAERIDKELRHGEQMVEGDAPKRDEDDAPGQTLLEVARPVPHPETVLQRRILVEQLVTSPVLAPEERKVLVSMFVEDRTEEATATVMQISQSQVSKTKTKAFAKLRSRLNP